MIKIRILSILAILTVCAMRQPPTAAAGPENIRAPEKIEYEGMLLTYNPAWKDKETRIEADLDMDTEIEVLLSFVATHKQRAEEPEKSGSFSVGASAKYQTPLLQNYTFTQIYDLQKNSRYTLVKTINGMDQLDEIILLYPDPAEPPMIAIFAKGGKTYRDLSIYQWREGGYRRIFNDASSGTIEISDPKGAPKISISRNSKTQAPRTDTFIWNKKTKDFMLETLVV